MKVVIKKMKKLIPALAILGSAVAFAIYKLKKDEQKQLMELDQDLLVDDNDNDEIIHLKPKHAEEPTIVEPPKPAPTVHIEVPHRKPLTPEAQAFITPAKPQPKVVPVSEPKEESETVYHDSQLAEALQSLKDQVEEPKTTDDIRQAIQDAISETQDKVEDVKEATKTVVQEVQEVKEAVVEKIEEPFAYATSEDEVEEEEDYNEEYPHLTNTLVEDINQMTQEAMDSLAADGDIHEHERPVQHMVSFNSMEDLDNFKNKVINKGFVITKGEGDMDLVVLHISPIDKVKLVSNILYLADQAYANNGEYKGWQSKVSY